MFFVLDRTELLGSVGINVPILGSDRIELDQCADPPQHNFYLSSERFPIDDQLFDVYALQL
jgi:catabolite regulation protein CreA